jgi:outer membrane protein OmpA-like peptidoglycan-associated protein
LVLSAQSPALAQSRPVEGASGGEQWFVGAYYRYDWIPSAILAPFFDIAPSIANHGFGLAVSRRARDGFTAQFGLGYMPYRFRGAFVGDGQPIEDTEYISSSVALVHLTASLLWPIQLHRMLALELGVGVDLGLLIGSLERTEAYPDSDGRFHACDAALQPALLSPSTDVDDNRIPYCEEAFDRNGDPIESNPANVSGAQYREKDDRVPPVMLFPMLPHIALRFAPHPQFAIKLEAAFGVAQFWIGASLHVGFEPASVEPAQEAPTPRAAVTAQGRVLGKLVESGTNLPIGHASVRTQRSFSPVETDPRGLFVFDKQAPGPMRFDVTHPDYEASSCQTVVPDYGGDVYVHCFMTATSKLGAISGQVKDEQDVPVARANIVITGPAQASMQTGSEGLFALPDAPEGTYRVRVDADGYFLQLVEVEVRSRDTAIPQIILLRKAGELVRREARQLSIRQQIIFEVNSAEIGPGSGELLRQIADMLLRNPDIKLIEIQGHTDNVGPAQHNRDLSQARAESVLGWLINAGVDVSRLRARGHGPDQPLRPNNSPENRAINRRVQFIVLDQGKR